MTRLALAAMVAVAVVQSVRLVLTQSDLLAAHDILKQYEES